MTTINAPTPVWIVADDLTGAAEIAGVAAEFGLAATVARHRSRELPPPSVSGNTALAVDTDTRSVPAFRAAEVIFSLPCPNSMLVYKKTDSVLRGNPGPEVLALMKRAGMSRALLLPQNPSKNRVIRNGHYFIDHLLLHETPFNIDPEHPRRSSSVVELLAPTPVHLVDPGQPLGSEGISIGNAQTLEDIAAFARNLPPEVLPAGGVDFFRALLRCRLTCPTPATRVENPPEQLRLVVSGSASRYSRETVLRWREREDPVHPLSSDLASILFSLQNEALAIVAITEPIDPLRASYLRQRLASRIQAIVTHPALAQQPLHLFIEGGGTAAAVVELLGWHEFSVVHTLAPGVVTLRPAQAPHVLLTIKPGTYPWPAGPISSW